VGEYLVDDYGIFSALASCVALPPASVQSDTGNDSDSTTTLNAEAGHERVQFEIIDTGIGLDEEKRLHLFDRFTQADSSTTRNYGGTGLGLAISRQLVELMDGEIEVQSTPGDGSTFRFTLVLALGEAHTQPPAREPDLSRQRVLVVDDNATNRLMLDQVLDNWGMSHQLAVSAPAALQMLHEATDEGWSYTIALIDMQMPDMNGEQLGVAIQQDAKLAATRTVLLTSQGRRGDARKMQEVGFAGYLNKPIDLVFMDCQMPVMDGYQASRRIRDPQSAVKDHDVPVVAMTANAMQGDREKCLTAGMNDYIAKPVDPGKLQQALLHWLPASCHLSPQAGDNSSNTADDMSLDTKTEPEEDAQPVFDYEEMSARLMGDSDLIATVVSAFVDDMPMQIAQLNEAVADDDVEQAYAQAYKIKGAAANLGGVALSEQAKILETAGRAGDLDSIRQGVGALERRFAELKEQMGQRL